MSPCESVREDLTAFAFGDLPPLRMGEVGMHAGACADCRAELEEIRAALDLTALWEAPEPTASLALPPRRRPAPWRWAAAAALLLAAGGAWALRPRTPTPPAARPVDPAVAEILREEGRPDLADRLLASCSAAEAASRAPRILLEIRAWVPDARSYLSGKARAGDPAALALLARTWPDQALLAAPGLLADPRGASRALETLEAAGVETLGLAPALLRAGLLDEAGRTLRGGKGRLPLKETLEAWEAAGEPGEADLAAALDRQSTEALLDAARRKGQGGTWRLAVGILASRKDRRVPELLAGAGKTRGADVQRILEGLDDARLKARACDLLAEAWWKDPSGELPALPGIREALGRRVAARPREASDALLRLEACDDILASALQAAVDPIPVLRLATRFGTDALAPSIEERIRIQPGIRGLALSVLDSLPPAPPPTGRPVEPILSA